MNFCKNVTSRTKIIFLDDINSYFHGFAFENIKQYLFDLSPFEIINAATDFWNAQFGNLMFNLKFS